jgi:lipoate-protein ligase A
MNGTICSANNGMGNVNNYTSSWTYYISTINDISIGEIVKGAKVGGTTYDISRGKITTGAEI